MSVDELVRKFRDFLNISISSVDRILAESDEAGEFINDWMQANWEILVESIFCAKSKGFLEVYGDGADCNGQSSRVWKPEAIATHQVFCRSKRESEIKDFLSGRSVDPESIGFHSFVSWDGKKYGHHPPLNYVLLEDNNGRFVVAVADVFFEIRTLN